MDFTFCSSLLFTPANKPERFKKAAGVHAGGIIIDLEDGVADLDKTRAREIAIEYLKQPSQDHTLQLLRVNHLATRAGLEDILAISQVALPGCHGIVHPKTEHAHTLNLIDDILSATQHSKPLLAFIETSIGLSQVEDIALHARALSGLMFGAADYSVTVHTALTQNALLYARSKIAQAAALRKLACFDSPYFDFRDSAGLQQETAFVQSLGYSGKLAIHPNQIQIINDTFKPTVAQYEEAKQIIAIYDAAKGNACQYQGNMIDVPIYKLALRRIKLYERTSLT